MTEKDINSLAHTRWRCQYHVVFAPKYRRKIIYNQYRTSLQEIIRTLCKYKGVEILEGHMMPDHVHLLLSIAADHTTRWTGGYDCLVKNYIICQTSVRRRTYAE